MRRTGIFFHYQEGERLRDFPQALTGILNRDNVFLFDAFYPLKAPSSFELEPLSEETLSLVHTPVMISQVKATEAYQGALFSAAGTVAAAMRTWQGEIDNAFVFTGYGDHHAGSSFFGGGCYFNGAAIAIRELRRRFGVRKVAIIDTDAHHGNGTWQVFESDPETLYCCLCSGSYVETSNEVNIEVPWTTSDDNYVRLVREGFCPRARRFQPECLFWNWGYDGTRGEYGDMGLTPDCHVRLAQELTRAAEELCSGRLIVVLCGGSRRDLARLVIPQVISVLCEQTA
jgi:acetoin utilization deacetylase AcuC-like enzyme